MFSWLKARCSASKPRTHMKLRDFTTVLYSAGRKNRKGEGWLSRQESNLDQSLIRGPLYPLSYGTPTILHAAQACCRTPGPDLLVQGDAEPDGRCS